MSTKVTASTAKPLVMHAMKSGVVPMIHGSPGLGKSDLIKSICSTLNLQLIDIRLSQIEPTDLMGLPNFKDGLAAYMPFDIFPLAGDKLPEGKNGYVPQQPSKPLPDPE